MAMRLKKVTEAQEEQYPTEAEMKAIRSSMTAAALSDPALV